MLRSAALFFISVSVSGLASLFGLSSYVRAEPVPGDLFREYTFSNTYGDAGGAIRVGGKKGESYPDRGSDFGYVNAWIPFPHNLDLESAVKAEVVVEKILSHNGTHGLAVQWNEGDWIGLPEPSAIPQPRSEYYHHTCITVPVPLEDLRGNSNENQFRLKIQPEQGWNWPQHLVYGVHLRIYYDAATKQHVTANITSPSRGETLGRHVDLAVEVDARSRRVDRVDFVGRYEDVNWEGDGVYDRWHYFYYHGQLTQHLGSSVTHPFTCRWDTSWVPDQVGPMLIAARVTDDSGLTLLTPAVSDLRLERPGLKVELCKPFDVPTNWVTRSGAYEESVTIQGDLRKATAARLVWSSWSPGYMNGVSINGTTILESEGPRYRYFDHRVAVPDLSLLKPGRNAIATGKTPLYDGKMVHGMEVNWPGIQLLIQYAE